MAVLMLAVLLPAVGVHSAEAAVRKKKQHVARAPVDRFGAVVIEASTGYVLSEKNADKRLYPASLTKMMTLYLAFEAMSSGRIDKNRRLPISKRASRQEPSSLGLQNGDSIRLEDAILGIATKSANDCAVVLAEALGGSEERFARAMTMKARQLGMTNTRFINASGLYNAQQVSTARDISILAQALIRDYPAYYRYFGTDSFTYEGNTYHNHNKLMGSYKGMDGLKTGYVNASGYNLAASAVQNGTRLIGVIFGGTTAKSRNAAMAKLLDQGFARLSNVRVATLAKPKAVPVRRKAVVREDVAEPFMLEPAMGQERDQGDTSIAEDRTVVKKLTAKKQTVKKSAALFKPHSLNTASLNKVSSAKKGGWAVQIGAFATPEAGMLAIKNAQKILLSRKMDGVDAVAPLMTNRGMVYRARLSGLERGDAATACRILRGSCLVLAVK